MRVALMAAFAVAALACESGAPGPADLDSRNDSCAECRMAVSNPRFASQLVAPGEEPRFFDDLGCLAGYLLHHPGLPPGSAAFVADHRSGEWVPAASAVFTRVAGLDTPMGSHVLAHASAASRDADPDARGGSAADPHGFFGGLLPESSR